MRRIPLGPVAVGLTLLFAVTLTACDGGDDRGEGTGSSEPAAPAPRQVYRIKDAETAVEGEDYEVLRTIPGPIGYKAQLLLDDGAIVLEHEHRFSRADGSSLPDLVQVWDPATDRRETLPIRWPRYVSRVSATSATDLWVSYSRSGRSGKRHQVMHYDRDTGRSRVYTAPSVPRARRNHPMGPIVVAPDGRLYFLTGSAFCIRSHCRDLEDRQLWSFAPGAPERVRLEATDVGSFAVSATAVAWVEPQDDSSDASKRLSVRRHGSERVHTTEVAECHSASLTPLVQLSEDLVLACGELYDLRAREVARLHIYSHGLSAITERWVAWGWTVLDPRTGRLLRILDDRVWHNRGVVMNDDQILWPGPDGPSNSRGADWILARLLPS